MTKETKSKTKIKNPLLDEETLPPTSTGQAPVIDDEEIESEEEVTETPVAKVAKATPKPVVDVAQEFKSDVNTAKKNLESEAQVSIMIPLAQGEKAGATHDCYINGYKVTVKKGAMVTVPQSIANLIAQHYEIDMNLGADFLVEGDQDRANALS